MGAGLFCGKGVLFFLGPKGKGKLGLKTLASKNSFLLRYDEEDLKNEKNRMYKYYGSSVVIRNF